MLRPWRIARSLLCLVVLTHEARAGVKASSMLGTARASFVQSSDSGERCAERPAPRFVSAPSRAAVTITLVPDSTRQTIVGLGGALTEASAHVLARLRPSQRDSVLDDLFGSSGLDLTMARTHIGSCDFSVRGRYSYAERADDSTLTSFSLAPDSAGFAEVRDSSYDLLPLLRDALRRQPRLAIVASPWTAPAWMKDNGLYFDKGKRGGQLLPQHYPTFAHYMRRYVDAYATAGVPLWGVTPINEPLGVGGQWESMEMAPEALRTYIGRHLGPALAGTGVRILQYDQNREPAALDYARAVFEDSLAGSYTWGTAVHWYSATNSARGDILDRLQAIAPDKPLMMTEGCIDGIGNEANVRDGRFLGWRDDAWWWQERAADWGWYWAPPQDKPDHPRYAPVHRYARDLIDGLRHGFVGWIDWNLVLDSRGGPNHQGNLCGAPIMIEPATGFVYHTPVYSVLAHATRYVRPGDRVVTTTVRGGTLAPDELHAVGVKSADGRMLTLLVFHRGSSELAYDVVVGDRHARVRIPAQAIQTWRFPLAD